MPKPIRGKPRPSSVPGRHGRQQPPPWRRPTLEVLEQRQLLASPDAFEPDDTPAQAGVIALDGTPQVHSIDDGGYDIDWVRFTLASESDVLVQTTAADGMEVALFGNTDTENPIRDGDWYTGILRGYALPPGTYLLQMQTYGSEVDTYSISVRANSPVPVLERIDYVRLAGEGFNSIQFTPDGRLAQLLWYGGTLTYRVRNVDGQFVEESIKTLPHLDRGAYYPRDFTQAQLLFTATGTPHVLMSTNGLLDHYRRDESGWTLVENIPLNLADDEEIGHLAAAVGTHDSLHFVVTAGEWPVWYTAQGRLVYGSNQSGVWQVNQAASVAAPDSGTWAHQADSRRFVSLAVDANNKAHVVYTPVFGNNCEYCQYARPYSQLAYATNRTGVWNTEIVHQPPDDSGDSGSGASIAIAPDGQPAIAQCFVDRVSTGSPSLARLQYHKRQSNGVWVTETVVSSPDGYVAGDGPNYTGFAPHLLFDRDGTPHIAFCDYASQHFPQTGAVEFAGQIRYAVKTGGSWQIHKVVPQSDPLHNQMIYPTMALWSNEVVIVGIRRYDFLNSDSMAIRSDHFYVSATLPRTGLTIHTSELTMAENSQVTLTVTRHNGNNAVPLTVRLTNGDASEVAFATEVTIPAGQSSVTTTVTALNDNVEDGMQTVSMTAAAAGYVTARTVVNVVDQPYVQIHGTTFADLDADGARGAAEPGLSGWTILVDLNRNGVWDAAEPQVTTDANGAYSFTDLRAGSYLVVAVPQAGWGSTTPLSGSYPVTLSGGQVAQGIDFGSVRAGFDLPTGRLVVLAVGDDQLRLTTNAGQVVVLRNGQPDSEPANLPAESVMSLVVLGGTGDNRIDLQGVTRAEFMALTSVVVREPGVGVDEIKGTAGADWFFTGGADTLQGFDGDDSFGVRDFDFAAIDGGPGQDTLRFDGSGLQLDLSALESGRLSSIEVIDLGGTGPNQLTLDAAKVLGLSTETDTLFVYANGDDRLNFAAAWTFVGPLFVDDRFYNCVTREDATVYLHGPHAWQNPLNRLDVNRDEYISPMDALLLINALNRGEAGSLSNPETSGQLPIRSYDVYGDDMLSPIDALLVINFLNSTGAGEGESPAHTDAMPSLTFTHRMLTGTLTAGSPRVFRGDPPAGSTTAPSVPARQALLAYPSVDGHTHRARRVVFAGFQRRSLPNDLEVTLDAMVNEMRNRG